MANIDYNSVPGDITFFPSNITYPAWFCDQNTGGIQIATRGAPVIPNTIQIGNASSTLKVYGKTTFETVQVGNTTISSTAISSTMISATTISATKVSTNTVSTNTISATTVSSNTVSTSEINISGSQNKLTLTENGINSSGFDLNVQNGQIKVQGQDIQTGFSGGIHSQYLSIFVNNQPYKLELHLPGSL